jgi:hypothetical protein
MAKFSNAVVQTVPEEEIPEVIEFLDAQTRLESFKSRNSKLMKELEELLGEYNRTLENADKTVRERGVNCGPWIQLSPTVTYDGAKLYNAVGREDFVLLGGVVRQVSEYGVDKAALEAAIASGKIPAPIVESVRKVGRKYKSIPKGELP